MPAPALSLAQLRETIGRRFPPASRPADSRLRTGIPAVDEPTGGLPRHALTELVCARPGAGGHLLLAQLLAVTRRQPARVGLVDAADQFDPDSIPEEDLVHLVWVRCGGLAEALAAADVLVRETAFDLAVIDLAAIPLRELWRTPSTCWYRLQRAIAATDLAGLVVTPAALVPSAELRLHLDGGHGLAAQARPRPQLAGKLAVAVGRQRRSAAQA